MTLGSVEYSSGYLEENFAAVHGCFINCIYMLSRNVPQENLLPCSAMYMHACRVYIAQVIIVTVKVFLPFG